jgi:hypothetical protein
MIQSKEERRKRREERRRRGESHGDVCSATVQL